MDLIWGIIIFCLGTIVSGVIQIIIAIIYEQRFRRYYRIARRLITLIITNIYGNTLSMGIERYKIGQWEANVLILEGTPTEPYHHEKITCYLEETPLRLPDELQQIRDEVELEQDVIAEERGSRDFHNGAMVTLVDYRHDYTRISEDPQLFLRFRQTDYYTFLATAIRLDEPISSTYSSPRTFRSQYIVDKTYRTPNPFFATSFGVNIAVVTGDNFLIVGKRAESGVSHYHGVFDVPVMESVNPEKDRDLNQQLDIYETAKRGLREELGIVLEDKTLINFFTLHVDPRYCLYGLTGSVIASDYIRDDILGIRSRGVRDWWENPDLFFIPFNPQAVGQYIKNSGGASHFHPAAFVSIVQTLIWCFGEKEVNRALKQ